MAEPPIPSQKNLFQVYLRLRPPPPPTPQSSNSIYPTLPQPDRFLTVEPPSVPSSTSSSSSSSSSDDGRDETLPAESNIRPTHITLNPPNDNRRRAVEKFAFTKVFEEESTQLEVFRESGVVGLVEGVVGKEGGEGRDGLVATLGVTGSGKSHTILGSKSQRGITQLALDVLFRSLGKQILDPNMTTSLHATVAAADPSEAQVLTAGMFLDMSFGDGGMSRGGSRAGTPMVVCDERFLDVNSVAVHSVKGGKFGRGSRSQVADRGKREKAKYSLDSNQKVPGGYESSSPVQGIREEEEVGEPDEDTTKLQSSDINPLGLKNPFHEENSILLTQVTRTPNSKLPLPKSSTTTFSLPSYMSTTFPKAYKAFTKPSQKNPDSSFHSTSYGPSSSTTRRPPLKRPSALPQLPDISNITVETDSGSEYAILISMYEVYNDRIFDLLTPATSAGSKSSNPKDFRRRPLLFKPTESSPDRKVVAGLRKVLCSTLSEALLVLEAGLQERRVAGTGSNSVSSRSHGFFCVEVKKRRRTEKNGSGRGYWGGSALTIVDLAGSERARDAKTQGATLAEAGKINESLMYLGQCLSMQGEVGGNKPNLVPYRQCKLTELLFSNSFPTNTTTTTHNTNTSCLSSNHSRSLIHHRSPQKAIMVVTADPLGDFNATSQILRYSALAREVTVPRIPSVTSIILAQSQGANGPGNSGQSTSYFNTSRKGDIVGGYPINSATNTNTNHQDRGRTTPTETERETMEIAALEIARLSEEITTLRSELLLETQLRLELSAHLESANERLLEVEMEVREEMYEEMEKVLAGEMRRLRGVWVEEREEMEGFLDRKLEIFGRGLGLDEEEGEGEGEDKENVGPWREEVEVENEKLRREVEGLRRELACRSPSKAGGGRRVLAERGVGIGREGMGNETPEPDTLSVANVREEKSRIGRVKQQNGIGNGGVNGNGNGLGALERGMQDLRVKDREGLVQSSASASASREREKERERSKSVGRGGGRGSGATNGGGNGGINGGVNGSPVKKVRKLVARKWEVDED